MRRRQLILFGLLLLLAAVVLVLARRTRRAPYLPEDADHRLFVSGEACNACHGPEEGLPRGPNHPLGLDCMRCHSRR